MAAWSTEAYLYHADKKLTRQGAVLTDEADPDMAFLVTFAVARTDQVFYS